MREKVRAGKSERSRMRRGRKTERGRENERDSEKGSDREKQTAREIMKEKKWEKLGER